ncbi:MAG: winged helix-turn-helix transcriptional regulator [Thaumarchaeota archaeon]|nr:winged helix-turn-helix transcriptional regulator [Nitrososphaerota archaeon]
MPKVEVREIDSRLGRFCVITIGNTVLLTPCDTRMKIIKILAEKEMTADEMSKATGTAYSTVMDHMDVLEKAGIVTSFLRKDGGKRRICFKLNVSTDQKQNERILV